MPSDYEPAWDVLSPDEAVSTQALMQELAEVEWAKPIIRNIQRNGGLNRDKKSFCFELRFGSSLPAVGIDVEYEIPGENGSTLDFGFESSGANWKVELMRLSESQAMTDSTSSSVDNEGVIWSSSILSSNADDQRFSEAGETLKAIERICQKCEKGGRPHKFSLPSGELQVLLVDFREFLHGADTADLVHVGLGGEFVNQEELRQHWNGRLISGAFSDQTNLRGAQELRERVHFLGFVRQSNYSPGYFGESTRFIANPHLFSDVEAVRATISTWPLQPAKLLNAPN